MQNKPLRFKFSLLPGDLINGLAGIRQVCEKYQTTAELYLGLDIEWNMSGPIAEGRESKVTLTQNSMEMLSPLLLSQSYISKVDSLEAYYPEEYHKWCDAFHHFADFDYAARWYMDNPSPLIDLDKHHVMPIGLPYGNIFRWNFYCYPDMTCDLSKPWLDIEVNDLIPPDTIIINRTLRSHNNLDYSFLKKYESRLLFAGLPAEWVAFREQFNLTLPLLDIKNFMQLAVAIRSCSFFIGNQSLCFSLAEAMKVPRVLEVCKYLPNVIPSGPDAYDVRFQSALEWCVNELSKR